MDVIKGMARSPEPGIDSFCTFLEIRVIDVGLVNLGSNMPLVKGPGRENMNSPDLKIYLVIW